MHLFMSGVVGLLSLIAILLLGIWFQRSGFFPGFGIYSFVTVGLVVLSTAFFLLNVDSPIMGLAERISILLGFQWTFVLGLWLSSHQQVVPLEDG
jgi:hypothetical protein